MNVNKIENVVIYTRVSTEGQIDGYSLDAQKEDLIKYCNRFGYSIVGEYQDAGISGTNIKNRPAMRSLLKAIAENDKIDAVLGWKLSRISRNMIDLGELLEYFKIHKVVLLTITDNIDTSTAMGKTFCILAGVFAEMERDNIVEQAKSGMSQRATLGQTNGGSAPYGYINNKDGKGLIIDPYAAEIIKTIFDLYVNKDYGYSKICQTLNREPDKYPTRFGKGWSYQSVQQVLDNPVYHGYIRWGKQSNWQNERRKGTTDNCIIAKGIHEAIIDDELWEITQARRKQKSKIYTPVKLENMHYLLSGLAKCPQCGASMITQRTQRIRKSDGKKFWYRYYGCSQWANKKAMCKPNLVNADLLEQRVLMRIKDFVQNPALPNLLASRIGKDTNLQELEDQIKIIDKRIRTLKSNEDSYYAILIDKKKLETLKEDKLMEMIRKLNDEMSQKVIEKEALSIQFENQKNIGFDVNKITAFLKNFDVIFKHATFDQQKALLRSLIKEIKITASDNINQRLESAVILRFSELDLIKYSTDSNSEKPFEVTYGTVHP